MQSAAENIPPSTRAGRKFLIVDDERLNRRILDGILEPKGFEVTAADSGEQALEPYPQVAPGLVLLHVVLPGITGFDACRQLHLRYGPVTAPSSFECTH
jgi:CheY-like chemotaxis protein